MYVYKHIIYSSLSHFTIVFLVFYFRIVKTHIPLMFLQQQKQKKGTINNKFHRIKKNM